MTEKPIDDKLYLYYDEKDLSDSVISVCSCQMNRVFPNSKKPDEKEILLKKKKRSVLFIIAVNLLLIAGIVVVGWKIWDYVNDSRQTKELAEELWEQAAITTAPATVNAAVTQTDQVSAAHSAEAKPEDHIAAVNTEKVGQDQVSSDQSTETNPEDHIAVVNTDKVGQKESVQKETKENNTTGNSEETLRPETTPFPNAQEKSSGEGGSAFLKMLNATVTPEPAPRFTDMPDIPVGIDFEKLAKVNRAVACWLYHPGIGVNLPVVHGPDNEYYLRRGFNRYDRQAGTLFIDYRNKGDFSDRNTIIYGHGRRDLTMFGKLHYYKNAEFCEKNPFFYLYLPGYRYRLEIVATGYTKDASDYYDLPAGDYWDELLDRLMEQSPYDFGIPISPEDHYVTLSTCAYDYQDERWIVIARIDDPDGTLP